MFTLLEIAQATQGQIFGSQPIRLSGVSIDSRAIKKDNLFLAIKGDRFDGHDFILDAVKKGASCAVISQKDLVDKIQGKIPLILVKDTTKALGELANFYRKKINPKVVAVTGSNGKTSTKDLIYHILSPEFKCMKNEGTKNNQFGLPMTILAMDKKTEILVLEMGTNHPGEIAYLAQIAQPDIGVLTNIGSSHLEHFVSKENVFQEKVSLIKYLQPKAALVLNSDDVFLSKVKFERIVYFGIKKKADFFASEIKFNKCGYDLLINSKHKARLNLLGQHNIYNALAAISVADILGIELKQIIKSLSSFALPKMRLEITQISQISVINDAYNANPDSFRAAVDSLEEIPAKGRKIIVAADMLELGKDSQEFHRQLGKYIADKKCADILFGVGNLAKDLIESAILNGQKAKVFDSFEAAAEVIVKEIKEGDVLLIKGSRMMQMERLLDKLKERFN